MGKTVQVLEIKGQEFYEKAFNNNKTEFKDPIIETFIYQSKEGLNVPKIANKNTKMRSFARLNSLRRRLKQWEVWLAKYCGKTISEVDEKDLIGIHNRLVKGNIKTRDGRIYLSIREYVRDIKAFWHWYQKYSRKELGNIIPDITEDMDSSTSEKPSFHYFDFDTFKKLVSEANYEYRVLLWFLYDTGLRPKELINIRVFDITEKDDVVYLDVRDEVSKTFARKFKLILSRDMIKEWIVRQKLKKNDFLFDINIKYANEYIQRLGFKVLNLGEEYRIVKGKRNIPKYRNGLTVYDFRHLSSCYWLPKYKQESAFMYRFGWRKRRMIEYYTEFLGMKDTITEDDLVDAEAKTRLEKELEVEKRKREMLEEEMMSQRAQLDVVIKMLAKQGAFKNDIKLKS